MPLEVLCCVYFTFSQISSLSLDLLDQVSVTWCSRALWSTVNHIWCSRHESKKLFLSSNDHEVRFKNLFYCRNRNKYCYPSITVFGDSDVVILVVVTARASLSVCFELLLNIDAIGRGVQLMSPTHDTLRIRAVNLLSCTLPILVRPNIQLQCNNLN